MILLMLIGCLNESPIEEIDFQVASAAEILHYLEAEGDYINSEFTPTVLNASDVYATLQEFLILDIREVSKFNKGHIESAKNITTYDLLDYILNLEESNKTVVIVCEEGQRSGYYVSLLRLLGKKNVHALNFGMASWHIDFAENMLSGFADVKPPNNFKDIVYPKADFTEFPNIEIDQNAETSQQKLLSRVRYVWNNDFLINQLPRVDEDNYEEEMITKYFICYGDDALYRPDEVNGSHQIGVTNYRHHYFYDLRSTNYLQTLPAAKTIFIYSYHGQLSTYIAAYLNILGYKVRSLKYGGMSYPFIRAQLLSHNDPRVLDSSKVMNYPYVIGP